MDMSFSYSGNAVYDKVNRDFKDLSDEDIKKEIERGKNDKEKYQNITVSSSDGDKKTLKAVTFRDPLKNNELITVRLTEKNIENLKKKFGEESFLELENGSTRLIREVEEFVATWFEDIKYNRGFDNKGADFELQYDYFDNKLGGEISNVDVKMTENYLNLGKMKTLAREITEHQLRGLSKEQKASLSEEIRQANIMSQYLQKYVEIFEADGGRNLTDELNATLRIDEDFDGQIDIDENLKRDKDSQMSAKEFFTNLAKDFNEKYSKEGFVEEGFEENEKTNFMSFSDKADLLDKIKSMRKDNKNELDNQESTQEALRKKEEIKESIVADISKGANALKNDWQIVNDLLFDNKDLEKEDKKLKDEESKKADEIQRVVEESLTDSIREVIDELVDNSPNDIIDRGFEEEKLIGAIVGVYNRLYQESDRENFTNKLFDDFKSVEDYELNTEYRADYSAYLGAKNLLQEIEEFANKRGYSDYYMSTDEYKKEFFKLYEDKKAYAKERITSSAYSFGRNLVRAKEQPLHTWKVKFENIKNEIEKSMESSSDTEVEKQKEREIRVLDNLLNDLNRV